MPSWKSLTLKEDSVWLTKPCMVPSALYVYRYTRRGMKSDVKEITNAWPGTAGERGPSGARNAPPQPGPGTLCPPAGDATITSGGPAEGWGHSCQPRGSLRGWAQAARRGRA